MINELTVEITQKCTNNCIFCSSESSLICTNKIDLETFKNIISDAVKLKGDEEQWLYISGGEPFLHEDLVNMVSFAKKHGFKISIYTSGIIVKDNNKFNSIDCSILTKLAKLDIDKIIFDIQSVNEKTYNVLMGTVNRLPLAIKSIKNSVKLGINTEVHFIPTKLNYKELPEVVEYISSLGIKRISLLRFVPQGRGEKSKSLISMNEQELEEFKSAAKAVRDKYKNKIDVRIGIPLNDGRDTNSCVAGDTKIVVRYDSKVFPCEAFKGFEEFINPDAEGEDAYAGGCYQTFYNIKDIVVPESVKEKSLIDIYYNSKYLNFVRKYIKKFKISECNKCKNF